MSKLVLLVLFVSVVPLRALPMKKDASVVYDAVAQRSGDYASLAENRVGMTTPSFHYRICKPDVNCLEDSSGSIRYYSRQSNAETFTFEATTSSSGLECNYVKSHGDSYLRGSESSISFAASAPSTDDGKWQIYAYGEYFRFFNLGDNKWMEYWNNHDVPKEYSYRHSDGLWSMWQRTSGNALLEKSAAAESNGTKPGGEVPKKKLVRTMKKPKGENAARALTIEEHGRLQETPVERKGSESALERTAAKPGKHWSICKGTSNCIEDRSGSIAFHGSHSSAETFTFIAASCSNGETLCNKVKSHGGNYLIADSSRASFQSAEPTDDNGLWKIEAVGEHFRFLHVGTNTWLEKWTSQSTPREYAWRHSDGLWTLYQHNSGRHL